jgi:hypothetical protein
MPNPEESDYDSEPAAPPQTPRASGEASSPRSSAQTPFPLSRTREAAPEEGPAPSDPSDTLLSAGTPADRLELMLEDRLARVDERLRELDSRLNILEQKKSVPAPAAQQKPWLWIAFLIAVVAVFQLLHALR